LKYRREKRLAEVLGSMIVSVCVSTSHDEVLCPVPLHWSRRFFRGFNQSQLLANVVARERGFLVESLLRRIRPTGHQAKRSREERLVSLHGSFTVVSQELPHRVILIDDLSTTGATLDACAKCLKDAGVAVVEAWVVARA
jgi:ComF family protein